MKTEFRYCTGEDIQIGDRVRTGSGHFGIVDQIIPVGSDSKKWYGCPDGGIGITEDFNGTPGATLLTPDSIEWPELKFIARKSVVD